MTNNEKFFYQFWDEKLRGKISAPTQYVLEAYKILYGKDYTEGTCNQCLSATAQQMKNRYFDLKKEIETTSVEIETFVQKQSEIENVVAPKNKGGRPKKS